MAPPGMEGADLPDEGQGMRRFGRDVAPPQRVIDRRDPVDPLESRLQEGVGVLANGVAAAK